MEWIDPGMESQRIDKWLWHARIVRTRTLATNLVNSGKVRVDRRRFSRASQTVRLGHIVTAPQGRQIKSLKIIGFAGRRVPASQVTHLYEDPSPAPGEQKSANAKERHIDPHPVPAQREAGAGRPSKRDRRLIEKLRNRSD